MNLLITHVKIMSEEQKLIGSKFNTLEPPCTLMSLETRVKEQGHQS